MGVKFSIGSWAYLFGEYEKNPISMQEVANRLEELEFDGLSLGGFKPHGHYELYPTKEDRKTLVDLFKSHNLEINAYAADLWSFPFATGGEYQCRYPLYLQLSLRLYQLVLFASRSDSTSRPSQGKLSTFH